MIKGQGTKLQNGLMRILRRSRVKQSSRNNSANNSELFDHIIRDRSLVAVIGCKTADSKHANTGSVYFDWLDDAVLSNLSSGITKFDVVIIFGDIDWRATRKLFDVGFLKITDTADDVTQASIYRRSDLMPKLPHIHSQTRGHVSMTTFGAHGRFGNQLFQYIFIWFYALRHELSPALPSWNEAAIFGLADLPSEWSPPSAIEFGPFEDDDLALWSMVDPPIDVDIRGYFQEIPSCWLPHRKFIRNLFTFEGTTQASITEWIRQLTRERSRPLISCHVRRGDYQDYTSDTHPWFRLVPLEWYKVWLRDKLRIFPNAVVFIATDNPEEILPHFSEFEAVSGLGAQLEAAVKPHHLDFEVMRQADILAIANSSFSRWASILANEGQDCWIPNFRSESLEVFRPWSTEPFWDRFGDANRDLYGQGSSSNALRHRALSLRQQLSAANHEINRLNNLVKV